MSISLPARATRGQIVPPEGIGTAVWPGGKVPVTWWRYWRQELANGWRFTRRPTFAAASDPRSAIGFSAGKAAPEGREVTGENYEDGRQKQDVIMNRMEYALTTAPVGVDPDDPAVLPPRLLPLRTNRSTYPLTNSPLVTKQTVGVSNQPSPIRLLQSAF
jgi:hypothetical protein